MIARFIVVMLFGFGVCYADSVYPDLCLSGGMDSQDVYECSKYKVEGAGKVLNDIYKDLNNRISIEYKADPKLGEELREYIKKSQRAWINLRDANCAIESFVISPETQAFETIRNNCVARESIERARYLKSLRF
ncbi:lysozyme inhibitor LprI family protein [Pseudomonas fluorescens]|uniref:Lysozyme inhibitor LprI-like N-terminal domain-containing protein n=1 Tax=Pseudomonas fluorescens TaxID=294 RepID=A0A5E7FAT0_PSEFL|nr:lysozyme inhibitor LprI family protein [Pseudomonas fluorescens]VVO36410.1 hypothetical protein PS691_05356 [Pseudomonas fluorescens]